MPKTESLGTKLLPIATWGRERGRVKREREGGGRVKREREGERERQKKVGEKERK